MRDIRLSLAVAGFTTMLAAPVLAQQMNMSPSSMSSMSSPADKDYSEAMDKMNKAMEAAPMTGKADQDFVAMMEPHHMSAVEMAKTELEYGKDPTLRKMAHDIIASQNKEIMQMKAWKASHPTTK